jgi:hypothetical protein
MGGSGSSLRYTSVNKEDVIKKIQSSTDLTQQNEYETSIAELLERLLGQLNNRDTDLIQQHLDNLISERSN